MMTEVLELETDEIDLEQAGIYSDCEDCECEPCTRINRYNLETVFLIGIVFPPVLLLLIGVGLVSKKTRTFEHYESRRRIRAWMVRSVLVLFIQATIAAFAFLALKDL